MATLVPTHATVSSHSCPSRASPIRRSSLRVSALKPTHINSFRIVYCADDGQLVMEKRRRQENEEETVRKRQRKRIIIYSSDEEESNNSSSNEEPEPGPSRDVSSHVATPDPVRAQSVPADNVENSASVENMEVDLDESLLLLLGDAPEPETIFGKAIHKDIAARWLEVVKKGLPKELKESLLKEYLIPSNCELLVPPILNPETVPALTPMFVKRDSSLMYRQKQTSNAISALAQAVEVIISDKCDQSLKQKILKPVNDASKILCDMHHNETVRRRKFVISSINSNMKETLSKSGTDKFLFGDNMSEKVKEAKNIQKSGEALKPPQQKSVFQKSNFYARNTFNKNRTNFKPLHQRTAGRQDAGKAPPGSSGGPRQSGSNQNRVRDRAQDRSRSPPPAPPPARRYYRR